jgi:hypothetical protein
MRGLEGKKARLRESGRSRVSIAPEAPAEAG